MQLPAILRWQTGWTGNICGRSASQHPHATTRAGWSVGCLSVWLSTSASPHVFAPSLRTPTPQLADDLIQMLLPASETEADATTKLLSSCLAAGVGSALPSCPAVCLRRMLQELPVPLLIVHLTMSCVCMQALEPGVDLLCDPVHAPTPARLHADKPICLNARRHPCTLPADSRCPSLPSISIANNHCLLTLPRRLCVCPPPGGACVRWGCIG